MAFKIEITKGGIYGVVNGETTELPIGHQQVVRKIPQAWASRCKVLKELPDSVMNDVKSNDGPAKRGEKADAAGGVQQNTQAKAGATPEQVDKAVADALAKAKAENDAAITKAVADAKAEVAKTKPAEPAKQATKTA